MTAETEHPKESATEDVVREEPASGERPVPEQLAGADETMGESTLAADDRLVGVVESILFASGEPLTLLRLAEIIAGASRAEIRAALAALATRLMAEGRGIRLAEVAGGYQLRTAPEHAEWVRRLFQEKPWRLTRATLETLSIIAYRQPITRAEIEAIRGVDADSVVGSLLSRKLVKIVGRKDVIGRPLLYGTTRQFLEVFGLKDLSALPALAEVTQPLPDGVAAGAAGGEEAWGGDEVGVDTAGDAAAEAAGGSGDLLPPISGGADSGGASPVERGNRNGAGDPGEAE